MVYDGTVRFCARYFDKKDRTAIDFLSSPSAALTIYVPSILFGPPHCRTTLNSPFAGL